MTDRYDQDMILGYVEGDLDDTQREVFEATLSQDHELRNLVAQMKLDRENLRSLGGTPAPIGLIDQVMQTQERAELLGDPEVPEPLPLKMPVNSYKFRRVLVYSGIAAVLLLSAALVVPTLMPSGLLNGPAQYAQNTSPEPSVDSGLALADEDAVYDKGVTGRIARLEADDSQTMSKAAVVGTATESAEKMIRQPKAVLADADTGPSPVEERTAGQPAAAGSVLALAEQEGTPDAVTPEAGLIGEVAYAEDVMPADSAPTESTLAMTEPINKVDEVEPVASALTVVEADRPEHVAATVDNPFMGYDNDASGVTPRTQLVVNASSPTRARREIRDWAMANSVHIVEEPAAASISRRAIAGGGAGDPVTRSQLFVEINEEQLPELLVYLNRVPSQQAELITPADADPPMLTAGLGGERSLTRSLAGQARNTERADADDETKAFANRPREVRSNWPSTSPGLASGLAPVKPARDANTKEAEAQPAESKDETSPPAEPLPDSEPGPARPFDWSQLFDSLTIKPAQPPAPPAAARTTRAATNRSRYPTGRG